MSFVYPREVGIVDGVAGDGARKDNPEETWPSHSHGADGNTRTRLVGGRCLSRWDADLACVTLSRHLFPHFQLWADGRRGLSKYLLVINNL